MTKPHEEDCLIPDLPPSMLSLTLACAESDSRHLAVIAETINDALLNMEAWPDDQAARDRLGALVWVMRDMAETLEWKLKQMDASFSLTRKGQVVT